MAERWLSSEELQSLTGWSARTIQRKAVDGELPRRTKRDRRPNGKPICEYSTRALSIELQAKAEKIAAHRGRVRKPAIGEGETPCQLALFSPPRSTVEEIRRPVTAAHDERVDRCMSAIAPYLELKSRPANRRFPAIVPDCTEVNSLGEAASKLGASLQVSGKTIKRWAAAFENGDTGDLLRRIRSDKGKAGFFARFPKAAWLVAYLYLEERMSVRVAHEAVLSDLQLLGIPAGDAPSYETVRAWLGQMPAALATYARLGRKAYRERMSPYLKRGYTDVYANAVWVGDHMIHDVECANDLFDEAEWGADQAAALRNDRLSQPLGGGRELGLGGQQPGHRGHHAPRHPKAWPSGASLC
jgi:hypothetical protein